MTGACDACMRRGELIAALADRIQGVLARPLHAVAGVLALSEEELIEALGGGRRAELTRLLEEFDPGPVRAALAQTGCGAVCEHSAGYPAGLRDLKDPPNPLYVRGGVARLAAFVAEPCVAIVGGRKCSAYAREVATHLGRGLAAADVTVISGLALGIDGASHRGALDADGRALAVLGCGPDVAYPAQHRSIYRDVVQQGVVVSELPPGTRPRPWTFPARNRIMAALAQVVVVVEARERSGSLITATFAEELHRDLAAVPGQVTARIAAGSNSLLREGAALVRHAGDVLDMLFGVGSHDAEMAKPAKVEPELRLVLDAVEVGDDLQQAARRAGLSAGGLRAALGRLETIGLIRSDGMGNYERCVGRPAST